MAKTNYPMIRIHDLSTDEVIDREMTAEEFAAFEAEQAIEVERKAEAEAKAAQKAELLARLGITEDEAKLLLG